MERKVEIGKVYRHFKGNYYFVEAIATDSETKEDMVVYRPLYEREDGKKLWVRPAKMFLEAIDKTRVDNITGQTDRFEVAEEMHENYQRRHMEQCKKEK